MIIHRPGLSRDIRDVCKQGFAFRYKYLWCVWENQDQFQSPSGPLNGPIVKSRNETELWRLGPRQLRPLQSRSLLGYCETDSAPSLQVQAVALKEFNYTYPEAAVNTFVASFYEAVMLYAYALNDTLEQGYEISNGSAVTRAMWNRTFPGEY